ncbi:MAG TPA: DUF6600 domain-containing protein [Kofleriaceae bacterium]|nr:DUF6600 domain-containing protein [Kofleriaceae bacterium]
MMKVEALRTVGTIGAHNRRMSAFRRVLGLVVLAGAAFSSGLASAQSQPVEVQGPPGGAMDPENPYPPDQTAPPVNDPGQQGPANPGDQGDPNAAMDPNGQYDPDGNYVDPNGQPPPDADMQGEDQGDEQGTGPVNDQEIDATLDGYGQWEDESDYGRVWVPYTTVVGVDFTPYETCGSWAWTTAGWAFNCDWGWGWLPFHYGRWGWFRGHWGWVPGHRWGPAWVEWRHGGGYVGWRPLGPGHGRVLDSHWRFAAVSDFGRPHIRSHLFNDPAEGLRVTSPVARVPFRGTARPIAAGSVMHARFAASAGGGARFDGRSTFRPGMPAHTSVRSDEPTWRAPARTAPSSSFRPAPSYHTSPGFRPTQTYRAPSRSYTAPSRSFSGGSHSFGGGGHSFGGGGGGHSFGGGGGGHGHR